MKSMALYPRNSLAMALLLTVSLTGCSKIGISGSVGPSARDVVQSPAKSAMAGINVVELSEPVVRRMRSGPPRASFADVIGDAMPVGTIVRPGDVLEVSIWEAPPATLFGNNISESRSISTPQTSRVSTLPELLVGLSGKVFIPFAGTVPVAGRSVQAIEADITGRLNGKAHLPQVIVRIARNMTSTVTIVGEVANSTRMPLTPKGERLLDALAQAGGVRQPVGKMTLQVTRGDSVSQMPLSAVIAEPRQNIILANGDVVTALFQPYSFTVLGAAGRNEEINFEATGLTLSQALGRIGGLQEQRANPKGVFIFRWESPATLTETGQAVGTPDRDGRVPTIYRVDMKNPGTYFLAQQFDIRNRDVVYISNSPIADFERFVTIISQTVLPVIAVENSLTN